MKYRIMVDSRMPTKTSPFPRFIMVSVNQRITPPRTMMTPKDPPMNMRKSQISAKYIEINVMKSVSGLKTWSRLICFTHCTGYKLLSVSGLVTNIEQSTL